MTTVSAVCQDTCLPWNAMSRVIRQASAVMMPLNVMNVPDGLNPTVSQLTTDTASSMAANTKNGMNRRKVAGQRRQFSSAYSRNSHGEIGVQ